MHGERAIPAQAMRDITWRRGPSVTRQMASHLRNNASINPPAKRTSESLPRTARRYSTPVTPIRLGHPQHAREGLRSSSPFEQQNRRFVFRRENHDFRMRNALPGIALKRFIERSAPASSPTPNRFLESRGYWNGSSKISPRFPGDGLRRGTSRAETRKSRENSEHAVPFVPRSLFVRPMLPLAANQIARLLGVSRSRRPNKGESCGGPKKGKRGCC